MPSKIPPLSIRPGPERLARIDAYASEHKLSRHLAIMLMLDEGYRSLILTVEAPTFTRMDQAPVTSPKPARPAEVTVTRAAPIKSRLKGEWKAP